MHAGDGALAGQRVPDRNRLFLGEGCQFVGRAGNVNATAGEDHRAFCVGQQLRRARKIVACRTGAPRRGMGRGRVREQIVGGKLEDAVADILRHIEQHRAGRPDVAMV